jgi:hypothetical protein
MKLHPVPVFSTLSTLLQHPLALLGGILFCLLPAPAVHAQGVTFAYAQTTVASGFSGVDDAVAVDGNGNAYVVDDGSGSLYELLAINGSIPARSALEPVGIDVETHPSPTSVAVDGIGDVYLANSVTVRQILAVNGVIPANPTIRTLNTGLQEPYALAVDSSGDLFVTSLQDSAPVEEILAVNGRVPVGPTINILATGFFYPYGLTVDAYGDVFVAGLNSPVSAATVREIVANDGTIPANPTIVDLTGVPYITAPFAVAVDGQGNAFVTVDGGVYELAAVNGSILPNTTPTAVGSGFSFAPRGVAVDRNGDVFVADSDNARLVELQLGSVNFGTVNVCPAGQTVTDPCSNTITLTYKVAAGTTIGEINVLVGGAKLLDFQVSHAASSRSCSAHTYRSAAICTVDVTFAPLAPGTRNGTVQILDGAGQVLVTTPVNGVGPNQSVTFPATPTQVPGSSVTLAATASSGLPVTFGSSTPTTCTVSGNTASLIATGYCQIQASQAGNAEYLAAIADQTVPVDHVTQTIDFPTIAPQVASLPLPLAATASSGLPVTFTSGTPAVCAVTKDRATLLIAGFCDIIATQAGNAEYFAAVTGQTFLVHHRGQVITFNAIASQPVGEMLPLTASSDSGLAISYDSATPTVCTVSGSTASLLKAGTCTIEASQPGDATWFPSGPKTVSFTVE